jgi:hypothetical protein
VWCVQLADEIFHPDKGFAERKLVMLVEGPPTPGMRAVLTRHAHARKIKYLQGSPFIPYVRPWAGGVELRGMLQPRAWLYITSM